MWHLFLFATFLCFLQIGKGLCSNNQVIPFISLRKAVEVTVSPVH